MRSNTLKTTIGIALLSLVGITACSTGQKKQNESGSATSPAALPVDVTVARSAAINQTESVAGTVVANQAVDIMSELSKKIILIFFKDGSYVSKGQSLYKLDDSDIRARIRQVEADLQLARLNESRMGELFKSESVRKEEYDVAKAKLQYLEASLELLQAEFSKTVIRAPFSGLLGISKVFVGSFVSPGMPLVSLQEQNTVKIQFTIAEKYLPFVIPGKTIQFTTELNNEPLSAKIISSESSLDMQSRSITVQAVAPNKKGVLKSGMSAKVFFNTTSEQLSGIRIPSEALIPGAGGYSVFVVKNGTASIKSVTIANRDENQAVISKGIMDGDSVMISNVLRAGDGVPVSIVSAN
ncbi:MAG TPA: efflux RND transporter periplasmic adaptor subunit [Chitinophagaceae bacterium]|nr:efflux RND transporter periplasmic adaptor subunit [Chitinophagaceae bacterium]